MQIKRRPFDTDFVGLPDTGIFLRVWSPAFAQLAGDVALQAAIEKADRFTSARIRRSDPQPSALKQSRMSFSTSVLPSANGDCERIYALPTGLVLEPRTEYKIFGWIAGQAKNSPLFMFNFRTGDGGKPLAY